MNSTISQLAPQSVWIGAGLLAAAALTLVLSLVQGRARRAPLGDLMAVFGGCVVLGAVVSRLFWMVLEPSVDLGLIWHDPWPVLDPRQGGHSSFGTLVGALVVVGLWCRSMWRQAARRMRARAGLDALTAGGLLGLALARLGCLADGCDFGKRADLVWLNRDWSMRHAPDTAAFYAHVERGWVGADAAWSAPVHPFALYLAVSTLLIVAWAAWAIWRRDFVAGQVALWASSAYLLVRFTAEFTRDEATVLDIYAGLNVHHLFAAVGLGVLVVAKVWLATCDQVAAKSSSSRNA